MRSPAFRQQCFFLPTLHAVKYYLFLKNNQEGMRNNVGWTTVSPALNGLFAEAQVSSHNCNTTVTDTSSDVGSRLHTRPPGTGPARRGNSGPLVHGPGSLCLLWTCRGSRQSKVTFLCSRSSRCQANPAVVPLPLAVFLSFWIVPSKQFLLRCFRSQGLGQMMGARRPLCPVL